MRKPTPRHIVRKHRSHLSEREREHEIREELERRYAFPALCVQLTHGRTLARDVAALPGGHRHPGVRPGRYDPVVDPATR